MYEHMRVVPVARLIAIGVRWFVVGALAGAAALLILQQHMEGWFAPRPPVVTEVGGGEGAVVRFEALRKGKPVRCTLTIHWRTNAWMVTC